MNNNYDKYGGGPTKKEIILKAIDNDEKIKNKTKERQEASLLDNLNKIPGLFMKRVATGFIDVIQTPLIKLQTMLEASPGQLPKDPKAYLQYMAEVWSLVMVDTEVKAKLKEFKELLDVEAGPLVQKLDNIMESINAVLGKNLSESDKIIQKGIREIIGNSRATFLSSIMNFPPIPLILTVINALTVPMVTFDMFNRLINEGILQQILEILEKVVPEVTESIGRLTLLLDGWSSVYGKMTSVVEEVKISLEKAKKAEANIDTNMRKNLTKLKPSPNLPKFDAKVLEKESGTISDSNKVPQYDSPRGERKNIAAAAAGGHRRKTKKGKTKNGKTKKGKTKKGKTKKGKTKNGKTKKGKTKKGKTKRTKRAKRKSPKKRNHKKRTNH
jgi:hypothetical protein